MSTPTPTPAATPALADLGPSLTRTLVPFVVGEAGGYGAEYLHLTAGQETTLVTALVGFGYYVLVRLLEHRWPIFGVLLGTAQAPVYPRGLSAAVDAIVAAALDAALAARLPAPGVPVPAQPVATAAAAPGPAASVVSLGAAPTAAAALTWADLDPTPQRRPPTV